MNNVDSYLSEVLLPPLERLDSDLQSRLGAHRSRVERMAAIGIEIDSVVSFGCGNGSETLALALILGAREVIGIDRDSTLVEQATRDVVDDLLVPIQHDIDRIKSILPGSPARLGLSDTIRSRLEQLLRRYENLCLPVHQLGDMTWGEASTHLPSNHFDLAYCHYVLYHIYCTGHGPAIEDTVSAVQEMARVIRPGGLVIAIEPDTCSEDDNTRVELCSFFEQVGLEPVSTDAWEGLADLGYVYSKPV